MFRPVSHDYSSSYATAMVARTAYPCVRHFHASARRAHLVGPPDPVSNLRPVVYDDDVPRPKSNVRHPYSLREFRGDTREYQWKMQRQQLDAYNHAFWTDSNTRFAANKSAVLESLPESCSAEDREFALSDFYCRWVNQEFAHQREYDVEWRKRNWSNILLSARLSYEKFVARMSRPFTPNDESRDQ